MSKRVAVVDRKDVGFPESALERELIAKYLSTKGYQMSDLKDLSEQVMHDLMQEACRYAALKLAEIEARSEFRRKIEAPD